MKGTTNIMEYVRDLEWKVLQAREQRNRYRLKCIWYYWPYALALGLGVGLIVGMLAMRIELWVNK
jgi:hypothetical protein